MKDSDSQISEKETAIDFVLTTIRKDDFEKCEGNPKEFQHKHLTVDFETWKMRKALRKIHRNKDMYVER